MSNKVDKSTMNTYPTIVKKYNIGYDDELNENENKDMQKLAGCKYFKICSREKMCGDCAADVFEMQRNEETWKKFKLEKQINLS